MAYGRPHLYLDQEISHFPETGENEGMATIEDETHFLDASQEMRRPRMPGPSHRFVNRPRRD
jgi:hypothetical protein